MVVLRVGELLRRVVIVACAILLCALAVDWGWSAVEQHASASLRANLVTRAPVAEPVVALTFTLDEADAEEANAVLHVIDGFGITATFFVTASLARSAPGLISSLVAAGDEVEPAADPLVDSTPTTAHWKAAMEADVEAVEGTSGQRPAFVQPPAGTLTGSFLDAAHSLGLTVTGASVNPGDALEPGTDVIIQRTLAGLRPGSILLLHATAETVAALPAIINGLRDRGYSALSLEALFTLASGQTEARSSPSHAMASLAGTAA